VSDIGFVRDEGKTLTARPRLNLDPKKMRTLDHLRRCPPLQTPNVLFNEMPPTSAGPTTPGRREVDFVVDLQARSLVGA
jgi:hypothetical protein